MNTEKLLAEAGQLRDSITEVRRRLHQLAETGFDLPDTLSLVKSELTAMGIRPIPCGQAGVTALIGGKKSGRVFLLRADMDALPITEQTDLPFASRSGRMHACGHDMHTAMLLGAARLLKNHEDEINGTVKLMFQPAEETFEGAKDMIDSGALESPAVDAALMIHVIAGMPLPAGSIMVSAPGVSASAADTFTITVRGKGCHGSLPSSGIDPITAAAHIIIALQELHARELPMGERAALTIGSVSAGAAANVIPDTASMRGTIRSFNEETRAFIKQRVEDIACGIAASFRAEAEVSFGSGCPTLVNSAELSTCSERYARELLGEELVPDAAKSGGGAGSEDFAYVSQQVPSIMLALAGGEPENGYKYPQHHPMVTFDESVLPTGSAVYAYTALRWLEEH